MTARIQTPLTGLLGIDCPVVQTGMGYVSGPRLVTAVSRACLLYTSPSPRD